MNANKDSSVENGWVRRSRIKRERLIGGGTAFALVLMAIYSPIDTRVRATPLANSKTTNSLNSNGRERTENSVEASGSAASNGAESHPLGPALALARDSLEHLRSNVKDYSALLIKRERINGKVGDHQFLDAKIRNRKKVDGRIVTPRSVYLRFRKPKSSAGREVIWVEGQNGGKLVAHEGGFKNLLTVWLKPENPFAMFGQRYPISEIGIENLIEKLIEKGEADMQHAECKVQIAKGAKVGDRICTMIQVDHPERRPYFEFSRSRIFIDEEHQLPIRYAAWSWPTEAGGELVLEEEYTYSQLRINVGLTDGDFSPKNSAYNYP